MDRYILASQSPRRRELLAAVIKEYEVLPAKGDEDVSCADPAEAVRELSRRKAMEVMEMVVAAAESAGNRDDGRLIVIGADTVVAVDGEILGKPVDRADAERMIGLIQGREHHVYTGVTVCWREPVQELDVVSEKQAAAGETVREKTDTEMKVIQDKAAAAAEAIPDQEAAAEAIPDQAAAAEAIPDQVTAAEAIPDQAAAAQAVPAQAAANPEARSFSFCEETAVEVFPMTQEEIEGYISLREPYDKAGAYGIQGAFCVFIKGIRGDYNNVVGLPVARLYHEMAARGLVQKANLR